MADIGVKIKLQGQEQVASEFKSFGSSLKSEANSIGKNLVAGFALAEIGKQIFEFTKKGIEAFQEEARVSAKLTQSLGYHSEALEKLAKATAQSTLYKQKDVIASQAVLSMYTHNEAEIKKLTPAVLDMAEALGIDLDSAARVVGKSLDQNTKMIGRTGIAIHGAAGSAERLDSIIKGLTEHFGGAAKAASDSQGAIGQLPKAMEELSKVTAQFLMPSIETFANYAIKMAHLGEKTSDAIDAVFVSLAGGNKGANAQQTLKTLTDNQIKQLNQIAQEKLKDTSLDEKTRQGILAVVSAREKELAIRAKLEKTGFLNEQGLPAEKHKDKKLSTEPSPEDKAAAKAKIKAEEEEQARINEVNSRGSEWRLKNYEEEYQASLQLDKDFHDQSIKSQEWANKVLEEDAKRNAKEREDASKLVLNKEDQLLDKTMSGRLIRMKREHKKELDDFKGTAQEKLKLTKMYNDEEVSFEKTSTLQKIQFTTSLVQNDLQALSTIADASKANAQVKKRLAEGEAVVQGATAIMNVWANPGYDDFGVPTGQIMQGVQTAFIVGETIAQISKIESAKMAYGGVVTGGTDGRDSVPAMLMPGEIVYNPRNPNPSLASMIGNTNTTNNSGDVHLHTGDIHIHGNADKSTVSAIAEIQESALINALKKAQSRGKIQSAGLKIYH